MNMTDVFYGIGHFCQWTFKFMPKLGNTPNVFFWIIIVSLLALWLKMQADYNKAAKKNNTLR